MKQPMLEYGSVIIIDNQRYKLQIGAGKTYGSIYMHWRHAAHRHEITFDFLGWQDLSSRRKFTKIILCFYKIANNLAPAYLSWNLEFKFPGILPD